MNEPLDIIIAVAVGLIALAAVTVVIALVPMIRKARQILSRVDTLIESTERDVRQTVGPSETQATLSGPASTHISFPLGPCW
jgi:uncharacterized protein YoxC